MCLHTQHLQHDRRNRLFDSAEGPQECEAKRTIKLFGK